MKDISSLLYGESFVSQSELQVGATEMFRDVVEQHTAGGGVVIFNMEDGQDIEAKHLHRREPQPEGVIRTCPANPEDQIAYPVVNQIDLRKVRGARFEKE